MTGIAEKAELNRQDRTCRTDRQKIKTVQGCQIRLIRKEMSKQDFRTGQPFIRQIFTEL